MNRILKNIELFDAGGKGKAIGRTAEGRIVMVSGAVPGDVVDVFIRRKKKSFIDGSVHAIHKYSDKRVEPKCEHFGTCGGCKWQNMDYKEQLNFKQKEVESNFKKIGHIQVEETLPIIPSEEIYEYRNKLEFSFTDNRWLSKEEIGSGVELEHRNGVGFHIPGYWDKILHVEKCWLQKEPTNDIRNSVYKFANEHGLSFYNVREKKGLLRNLMIRTTLSGEIMALFQFGENDHDQIGLLLNHLNNEFPEVTSFLYVINTKANDTIYDQNVIVYSGRDHIIEEMPSYFLEENLKFKIGPKSFYQTNPKQAFTLYKTALDFGEINENDLVYDLYTGTGTIACFLAQKAKHVVGVESVPEAIEDAKINAELNNISNIDFEVGDMKNVFNDDFIVKHGKPDVLVTDPPRDGMHKKVVEQILSLSPEKIVYISCNSATQARDLELLKEKYSVVKSQAVDMFPHTHHIENVCLLIVK